jgi:hypothetical protein
MSCGLFVKGAACGKHCVKLSSIEIHEVLIEVGLPVGFRGLQVTALHNVVPPFRRLQLLDSL